MFFFNILNSLYTVVLTFESVHELSYSQQSCWRARDGYGPGGAGVRSRVQLLATMRRRHREGRTELKKHSTERD